MQNDKFKFQTVANTRQMVPAKKSKKNPKPAQKKNPKTISHPFIYLYDWLVVWNMNFIFHFIYGIIIPTDELIFFRGVGQPPTR